ncbi:MAG: Vitamin B12 dependent methionine synthase activation subunit [Lachnospiraceae bacterium]|nr:Vitamin B12 dependent methionine synthase activation subunit [Lachnospiraceae bacterium]
MEVGVREILRYLRMREEEADGGLLTKLRGLTEELAGMIRPKAVFHRCGCRVDETEVRFMDCRIRSLHLARHLKGCRELYLFAATLGPGPDRLAARYRVTDRAGMVMVQAAATAMIERFCGEEQAKLAAACREEGLYVKPRFSPGYGDCSLDCQKEFFRRLDITRRIGVSLTEGKMMTPTKSVTAWIGITERDDCYAGKCGRCPNGDCEFREEIE